MDQLKALWPEILLSLKEEFNVQKRGGKGVKCYKITDKTGYVIGVKAVNDDHEIMMITTAGIIIQIRMEDVSTLGRITSGVKLINLDEKVAVAKIAKVREKVTDENGEIAVEDISNEVAEETAETDTGIERLLEAAEKDAEEEDES